MKLRGLYAITPDDADSTRLVARVRAALEAGAAGGWAALQYRNKSASPALRLEQAGLLATLARDRGVPFIVNDDVELAIAIDADGVHVGRDDAELSVARRRIPGKLLGVSCYDSLVAARAAVAAGADYVAFGSVFPSSTKPAAVRAPFALLREARALGVPVVAIGGIRLENAPAVLQAGADALAVISDLFDAPDVGARARAYLRLFPSDSRAMA
jgi:thiamine-phosphate pyrophosphorylase